MFQKMSAEEIERHLKEEDAQKNRETIIRNKNIPNTPAINPLHADIASEFSSRYGGSLYQPDNTQPSQSGVQNAVLKQKNYHGQQPVSKKQKRLVSLSRFALGQAKTNQPFESKTNSPNKTTLRTKKKQLIKKTLDIYGKTAGRGLMTSAYTWTNFIYLTFQIWLGIIAIVAIGFVLAIEHFVGDGVTRKAFNTFMSAIGVDWDFYLVALLCYLLVVIVCYIQLFGVVIQAKALGLHPLHGHGAFFKTGTFLGCFVLYWIPIFNCLPLVNLYIFSIQIYPR